MKKSWQVKVLLFFLTLFILTNIQSFFLNIVEFLVRLPLNFNSFMANVIGVDGWSKIIVATSSPISLLFIGLLLCIITIGTIRSLDSLKNR